MPWKSSIMPVSPGTLTLGAVIGLQIAELASDLPRYEGTIKAKVASAKSGSIGCLGF